jgi:hypothetical protein
MAYGNIKWEPWVCVLKDEKKRIVEVVRFDNFQDMMLWKESEEGLAVHKMEDVTVVSMTEGTIFSYTPTNRRCGGMKSNI